MKMRLLKFHSKNILFFFRDQRGFAIVEASITLTITILSVVSMIVVAGLMFQKAVYIAQLNMEALSKAGLETYTQEILHHSLNKGDFSKAGYIGRSYLKGKRKLFYKKIFLINKNIGGSINTRAYLINEKKFIRNVDLVIKKTGNKK